MKTKSEIFYELRQVLDYYENEISCDDPGLLFWSLLLTRLKDSIEYGCGWQDKVNNEHEKK
jgi:hypothetical protein